VWFPLTVARRDRPLTISLLKSWLARFERGRVGAPLLAAKSATRREILNASTGGAPSLAGTTLPTSKNAQHVLSGATPAAGRNLIFFICAIALFMGSIDATIVATALPRIGDALHSRLNWTGWTITIYALGEIIALPLAGKISDQFGRKKVFLLCIVLFTASSFACGLSTTIYMLIPLRFIQALGGGAFMPSASGIVADRFGVDRDRGIGMFSSIFPIGSMVGPIVGGVITQYWVWRGIFFINVPIGFVLFLLALRFIPKTRPHEPGRLDFRGIGFLSCTIVVAMLAITLFGERHTPLTNIVTVASALGAVVLGWQFMRHTRRSNAPLIPLRLLRGTGFLTMNLLNFFYGTAIFGFAVLAPLYAEDRYHIAISQAGTVMSARAIGTAGVAALATMALRRTGYRLPMVVGFITIAFSLVMISISALGLGQYWWLMLFSLVGGIGLGLAGPATNNATMHLAPDDVSTISGLRGMFREIGGILCISVSTTVLARSHDPGIAQAHIFLIQAAILLVMTSLVYLVPDHRGAW
jgi:EmrB/QacA subfamily drug resistance transporter